MRRITYVGPPGGDLVALAVAARLEAWGGRGGLGPGAGWVPRGGPPVLSKPGLIGPHDHAVARAATALAEGWVRSIPD